MGKDKLKRFEENKTFKSLFQPEFEEVFRKDYHMKGRWHKEYFRNDNPLVLELGCGRGEYTVDLARRYPNKNFIGVDIKGARLWRGARSVTEENLTNAAFLRTRIEFIEWLFAEGEVAEIWITFADPQIRRDNKRLTAPMFLERYKKFLIPGGIIHLKTDSPYLHEYTSALVEKNNLEVVSIIKDVYGSIASGDIPVELAGLLSIKTHYEEQFIAQGHPITYLSFKLTSDKRIVAPEWDHDKYPR
ncbi:MAG: tRNA (guanosine(46)-N7)-methyltransferase TrmB [Bacteroidales bacterium]|jgi:tRNA (guanine-N7-)-methyltransferase|nr:tRNA (guanosine(46)-N7)-methyltransferase TrmB [Bacteroidales bacterium]